MTDTDQKEDEVLKRMLKTPPKTHDKGKALRSARKKGVTEVTPSRSRKKPD
ncbi:hypothetical protein [Altererythrobacter sp. ZODW24]|uniref:hypothetical protein n=1 Tax=Altererythrobacter sp. ZODW24 TaxID=2185142 RepID=UPI0013B4767B|nr:hypothetical protein [Altererythrobacter sp. ZODW24]